MLSKTQIFSQLRSEMQSLHGFKQLWSDPENDVADLGQMNEAFAHKQFPVAGVHEFICATAEDLNASSGFIAGILGPLLSNDKTALWI